MASWVEPSDYWWLRPSPPESALPALQLGAQIVRQRAQDALRTRVVELEAQQTAIATQEAISKRELQNKIMAGDAELAKSMAGVRDWADPSVMDNLWKIAETYPVLMATPQWRESMKLHENAVMAREKVKEQQALRQSRSESANRRLDVLAQHYANQDEVAALRQEAREIAQISNDEFRNERLAQFERTISVKEALARDAGFVPADATTGMPAHFVDANGGIRFQPVASAPKVAPKWVPEDKATGMPAHFESNGRVQFPPRTMADGSTFQPQERMVGTTRLIHVSPNKWQVVERPIAAGALTAVEKEKLRDWRSQIASLLESYGDESKINELKAKVDELYMKAQQRAPAAVPSAAAPQLTIPDSVTFKSASPITKEEYDKLPVGAEYVAPDGSTRIKK